MYDLIDLDTLLKVKNAAPVVTQIPFDRAQAVVVAMQLFTKSNASHVDVNGQNYWEATVKQIVDLMELEGVSAKSVGSTVRAFGLESWRRVDGFHVAWSLEQLNILMESFYLE